MIRLAKSRAYRGTQGRVRYNSGVGNLAPSLQAAFKKAALIEFLLHINFSVSTQMLVYAYGRVSSRWTAMQISIGLCLHLLPHVYTFRSVSAHVCPVSSDVGLCPQMLACIYGGRLIEVDCYANMPLAEVKRVVRGAIQQGAWLHLRHSCHLTREVPPFDIKPLQVHSVVDLSPNVLMVPGRIRPDLLFERDWSR